jgi:uncharacterized membrane protein YqjE
MDESITSLRALTGLTKTLVRRLLIIGENRLELLGVEVQEGRDRMLQACLLSLGIAAFGMLACATLTVALVLALKAYSPVCVLLALTLIYGLAGVYLKRRLTALFQERQTLSASLEQLHKDRVSLEKLLQ